MRMMENSALYLDNCNLKIEMVGGHALATCFDEDYHWELEIYPDGFYRSRHCGYGDGCIWSDWEDYVTP